MSIFPGPWNAIVYAQFNLQGRWRRLLSVCGTYGLLIGAAIWLTSSVVGALGPGHLNDWVRGLMTLQFVAVAIGAFGVEVGIRRDITNRMIESHRLMPAPPLGSVLGYLFGTPMYAIGLMAVNFVLGLICCQVAGLPFADWVNANGLLWLFGLLIYSLIAQFAFVMPGSSVLLLFAAVPILANAADGTNVFPSVTVLIFPLLSHLSPVAQLFGSGWVSSSGSGTGYALAIGGQLAIIAIAIRVAVRRYTAARLIGITPLLGLMLLSVWVALAAGNFQLPDLFSYRNNSFSRDDVTTQTVTAIGTSLLIAMMPIASAALSRQRELTRYAHMWTPAIAIVIVCALLAAVRRDDLPPVIPIAQVQTCAVITAFLAGVACLFTAGYRLRRRAWIYVVFWVTITWLVPIVIDAVYRGMHNDTSDATMITAFSPPGSLALIWSASRVEIWPGLLGQAAMAMLPAGLALVIRRPVDLGSV